MDDLRAMKGLETLVAAILRDDYLIRLHRFNDGSWAIDREETHLGAREHEEITSCLDTFFQRLTHQPAARVRLLSNIDKATLASSARKFTGTHIQHTQSEIHMPLKGVMQRTETPHVSMSAAISSNNGGQPARLLMVDDHVDTLRAMEKLFTSAGYFVRTATNAGSALESMSRDTFDVIISDLCLGGMDGYDLMRKVRQQWSSIGIAISGYGMQKDIMKSREAGFVEHLIKPVNFEDVLNAVARAVAMRNGAT